MAYALEHGRRKREDARRFDKEQRELYVRCLSQANELKRHLFNRMAKQAPVDRDLTNAFMDACEELEALGSLPVLRYAVRLRDICVITLDREDVQPEDFARFAGRLLEFRDVVRAEIGLQPQNYASIEDLNFDESDDDPDDDYYTYNGTR